MEFSFPSLLTLFVPTIENGKELCIRVRLSFFLFYAKSSTTNNHWTLLSAKSYSNPFSYDSNHIKRFRQETNRFEIFDFSS